MNIGDKVQIRGANDTHWKSGYRIANLTDGGKVYVERDEANPGRGVLLMHPQEVRTPK